MQRKPVKIDLAVYPAAVRSFLCGGDLYDSSSSPDATVLFVNRDDGFFVKSAAAGALANEAAMTRYMCRLGLGATVLAYVTEKRDWLVTRKVRGHDCTFQRYIERPEQLCDTLAQILRQLHNLDGAACPIQNHTQRYLEVAAKNYRARHFDAQFGYDTAAQAWDVVRQYGHTLETRTLLHGDFCLPNVVLDDWRLGGLIDVGNGGIGDRHVDLFWALWSLRRNLHTDAYRRRFIDAYGRSDVDEERLRIVSAVEAFG